MKKSLNQKPKDGPKEKTRGPIRATVPLPERSDRRGFSYRAPANPEDEVAAEAEKSMDGTILPAHWKKAG